jgi:hypothetical protein
MYIIPYPTAETDSAELITMKMYKDQRNMEIYVQRHDCLVMEVAVLALAACFATHQPKSNAAGLVLPSATAAHRPALYYRPFSRGCKYFMICNSRCIYFKPVLNFVSRSKVGSLCNSRKWPEQNQVESLQNLVLFILQPEIYVNLGMCETQTNPKFVT